jgi:hypothetical protein
MTTKSDLARELADVKRELAERRRVGERLADEAWEIANVDRDAFNTWRCRWNAIKRAGQ